MYTLSFVEKCMFWCMEINSLDILLNYYFCSKKKQKTIKSDASLEWRVSEYINVRFWFVTMSGKVYCATLCFPHGEDDF